MFNFVMMESLGVRIVITWLGIAIAGSSVFFHFPEPFVAILCLAASSGFRRISRAPVTAAPNWFRRASYVLVVPTVFFLALGYWFGFIEPWAQVSRIAVRVAIPLLLVLAAYEDVKVWKGTRP